MIQSSSTANDIIQEHSTLRYISNIDTKWQYCKWKKYKSTVLKAKYIILTQVALQMKLQWYKNTVLQADYIILKENETIANSIIRQKQSTARLAITVITQHNTSSYMVIEQDANASYNTLICICVYICENLQIEFTTIATEHWYHLRHAHLCVAKI